MYLLLCSDARFLCHVDHTLLPATSFLTSTRVKVHVVAGKLIVVPSLVNICGNLMSLAYVVSISVCSLILTDSFTWPCIISLYLSQSFHELCNRGVDLLIITFFLTGAMIGERLDLDRNFVLLLYMLNDAFGNKRIVGLVFY